MQQAVSDGANGSGRGRHYANQTLASSGRPAGLSRSLARQHDGQRDELRTWVEAAPSAPLHHPDNGAVTLVVGRFEPLVGYGLARLLAEDPRVRILASGLDSVALERAVVRWAPRVAVLDEVPDSLMRGRVRSMLPATGVVVLAHRPSRQYGMRLLGSGVTCVARKVSVDDILAAIHLTAGGSCVFVSPGGEWVTRRYPANARLLTKRQAEVLTLISEGRTNPEIACALHISVETTRTHVAAILHKLDVRSRRELVGMPIQSRRDRSGG